MNILNQNITFSVGTVLSVVAILVLGNTFLTLLINYFIYEKKVWKEKLLLLEEDRKDFDNKVQEQVKKEVKKYQLDAKIHKLSSLFTAIEQLRINTPEYSHQTKYYKEVNQNLLDLDKNLFDEMITHIVGLLQYHRNRSYENYLKENDSL